MSIYLHHELEHDLYHEHSRLGPTPAMAHQSMTLSGLGLAAFDEVVLATMKIYQRFKDHCPQDHMDEWTCGHDHGHNTLTFSNRYLTLSQDCNLETVTPMNDIDPLNILQSLVPAGIHTSESDVLYFERVVMPTL